MFMHPTGHFLHFLHGDFSFQQPAQTVCCLSKQLQLKFRDCRQRLSIISLSWFPAGELVQHIPSKTHLPQKTLHHSNFWQEGAAAGNLLSLHPAAQQRGGFSSVQADKGLLCKTNSWLPVLHLQLVCKSTRLG